ncbi:dihydrofolate reductase family protein [Dactylosporangium roseum]|nr:dihydrofolate reductase family protein [Dactylosporangium roseum]
MIYASMFLTLDGVMEAPQVWHPAYASEESITMLAEQMAGATAMLLGRQTYEDFAGYWPRQPSEVPLADATNNIQKYVLSRTLSEAGWNKTTVLDGDLVEVVRTLKEQEHSVLVPGSAQLVRGLLHEHLLDELRITLDPIVVGSGRRLFPGGSPTTRLELRDCRPLPHGVIYLVYRPVRATGPQGSPS